MKLSMSRLLKRSPVLIVVAVLLASSAGAATAGQNVVGDQLGLVFPCLIDSSVVPHELGAGDPFHVSHGYVVDPNEENPVGQYTFDLWVDGVHQKAALHVSALEPPHGPFVEGEAFLERRYVSSFPDGLTGTHEFRALWTTPDGVDPGWGTDLDCTWNIDFP